MTYAYPWAFSFPLILIILLMLRKKTSESAVLVSSEQIFAPQAPSLKYILRQILVLTSSLATVFFLTLALARPQIVTVVKRNAPARNLMLALDISGSMRTRDFYVQYRPSSRLEAVKTVVSEFLQQRPDDRLGLVVFGTQAFLECPLTSDHNLLSTMVGELSVGLAGDGTAIGDGLGLALKRIQDVKGDSKAIILLTDGVNTSGSVSPLQAAKVADDLKIKVHTIGIGSKTTANNAQNSFFYSGNSKQFEFDEKLLKEIASTTGGVYFNASNIEQLQTVYDEIDLLERSKKDEPSLPVTQEFFPEYAGYALLAYLAYLLTVNLFFQRLPW